MANQEHLALIEQGVSVWNKWYKKHKRIVPDLTNANLSNRNLSGIDLRKANLTRANLSNTDLTKAQLAKANLEKANFLGTDLRDANLKGANLNYVIFSLARLNSKTIISDKFRHIWEIVNNESQDKNFTGIDLSHSNLFRADLSQADLSHAKLEKTNFSNANFSNAYLFKADLTEANLQNADLRNAYFSQANLTKVCLRDALCCGAYFKDAELNFASFKGAKLSQKTMIDLKWYSVWEIVNQGAVKKNLSGADLSNANLYGVNFAEANLTNANLSHTILCHSNLDRANLTNTNLGGANIRGVDLTQANLKGAKLRAIVGREINSTHSPVAVKSAPNNVMVQERPTTLQIITPEPKEEKVELDRNTDNPVKKPKKKRFSLFSLGFLALIVTGGYVYLRQNPDFSWQEISQRLQPWKDRVEQLIPAN